MLDIKRRLLAKDIEKKNMTDVACEMARMTAEDLLDRSQGRNHQHNGRA